MPGLNDRAGLATRPFCPICGKPRLVNRHDAHWRCAVCEAEFLIYIGVEHCQACHVDDTTGGSSSSSS
jgi:ribosomal protein S27AE